MLMLPSLTGTISHGRAIVNSSVFSLQWNEDGKWQLHANISSSVIGLINKVNRHSAQLVLGWVTVCGRVNHLGSNKSPRRFLNSAAPIYLADLCVEAASLPGRRRLRSASTVVLQVPSSRTLTGQRRFAVFGPSTWNSLPAALRTLDHTLSSFKRDLKTHLFCCFVEQ